MGRTMRALVGLVVALSVFECSALVYGAEASEQEKEIASLKTQIGLFRSQLMKKAAEVKKLREENRTLNQVNQRLQKELDTLKPAPEAVQEERKRSAHKADDKWKGFRGVMWGQDIKTVKGMVLVETSSTGRSKFYKRQGDEMKIGEAALSEIVYYFYRGKCAGVVVHSKGLTNWSSLKQAVLARFGKGSKSRYTDRWWWSRRFTPKLNCGDCVIYLAYNEFSKKDTLNLRSRSQIAREKADDKAAAEKAKDDF